MPGTAHHGCATLCDPGALLALRYNLPDRSTPCRAVPHVVELLSALSVLPHAPAPSQTSFGAEVVTALPKPSDTLTIRRLSSAPQGGGGKGVEAVFLKKMRAGWDVAFTD